MNIESEYPDTQRTDARDFLPRHSACMYVSEVEAHVLGREMNYRKEAPALERTRHL